MLIIAIITGLAIAAIGAMALIPRVTEYVETIEIAKPASQVHDAIRFQRDLMLWSAWPSETGSQCSVKGTDGAVGAQTVFLDKSGKQFGYQEVTRLSDGALVRFKLESKGPPHKPVLDLYTVPLDSQNTKVVLHFRNDITPPFHVILRIAGVVRWTRRMQQKDLHGLKCFLEEQKDYQGNKLQDAA